MKNTLRPLDYGTEAVEMMMQRFAAADLPPKGHFHYHQGVFLSGVDHIAQLCAPDRKRRYRQYLKDWVDSCMDAQGNFLNIEEGQIDDLQPGILLYPILEMEREAGKSDAEIAGSKYQRALDHLIGVYETYPRTADGGFWHRAWKEGQLWLDGLYMAGPFLAEYANRYHRADITELVVAHVRSVVSHNREERTGLLTHAYDETKQAEWADPVSGQSPEIWGRSVGWVPVAILDDLSQMDKESAGAKELAKIVRDLLTALLSYQSASGMWYQVIDKAQDKGNWPELSCTCLFIAAICKGLRTGVLDTENERFLAAAKKAYDAVISMLTYDAQGRIEIGHVCVGTGVGDYEFYCKRPTSVNDLHGVGAFLLMCAEAEQVL